MNNDYTIIMHRYNEIEIPQRAENGYCNLTKLGQSVNKRVDNWLRLDSTKELLKAFEEEQSRNYLGSEVEKIQPGIITIEGRNGGTYGHPDISISFAQWCDPKFALFVSRIVRDWMKKQQHPEIAEFTMSEKLLIILQKEIELEKIQKKILSEQQETNKRLKAIEDEKEAALEELKNTPLSDHAAQPITTRYLISKLVREYAHSKAIAYSVVWKQLYSDFVYRYHINLPQRAKSLGQNKNALDYLDLHPELMQHFYDLVSEKLGKKD